MFLIPAKIARTPVLEHTMRLTLHVNRLKVPTSPAAKRSAQHCLIQNFPNVPNSRTPCAPESHHTPNPLCSVQPRAAQCTGPSTLQVGLELPSEHLPGRPFIPFLPGKSSLSFKASPQAAVQEVVLHNPPSRMGISPPLPQAPVDSIYFVCGSASQPHCTLQAWNKYL